MGGSRSENNQKKGPDKSSNYRKHRGEGGQGLKGKRIGTTHNAKKKEGGGLHDNWGVKKF